jgi:ribonuclease HII
LTPAVREELFEPIRACALTCATGAASHDEIDSIGIVAASKLAMQRALDALSLAPDALLLDALVLHEVDLVQVGVVHGDGLSVSIAAASILAKVTRDRIMRELDGRFPGYCFSHNKGYGTPEHVAGLARLGPSPIHRRSYEPIRLLIEKGIAPEPEQPAGA